MYHLPILKTLSLSLSEHSNYTGSRAPEACSWHSDTELLGGKTGAGSQNVKADTFHQLAEVCSNHMRVDALVSISGHVLLPTGDS